MKKFLFILMFGILLSGTVYAGDGYPCKAHFGKYNTQGGFIGTDVKPMGYATVQKLPDGAKVVVEGYIINHLEDDEYTFSDGVNTIVVEIDDKDWQGQWVSPKDKVLIKGKVDKDDNIIKIDAKAVYLLNTRGI